MPSKEFAKKFEQNNNHDSGFESLDSPSNLNPVTNPVPRWPSTMSLEDSYVELKRCSNLIFDNQFDEAIEFLEEHSSDDLCSSHGAAVFHFLYAILTLEGVSSL